MAGTITRRQLLKLGAGLMLPAVLAPQAAIAKESRPMRRPNVLFILTDDQRFDTIAALGNREVHTPNTDTLVRDGVAFTRAYIMGGTDGAVCMPSRAMIHTGRALYRLHDRGSSIPAGHPMLGEAFRAAGYDAFGCGKWHNGRASYARSFTHGGRILFNGMSDQYNPNLMDFDPTGKYDGEIYHPKDRPELAGKHSSDIYTEAALDFVAHHDTTRPFFMYVAYQSPHDPRTAPRRFHDLYDPGQLTLPPSFMPEHPFRIGHDRIRDEMLAPFPRTPEVVRRHLADYYAMISHDDYQIGRLVRALKDKGFYDDTIIVFTGDNGLALGCHGLFGKQNVYDPSVHVPLIIAGPGIPRGERRDAFCHLNDIFPTLCDLCGLPLPNAGDPHGEADGRSLAPVIAGAEETRRDALAFAYIRYQRAILTDRWKLIHYDLDGLRTIQLFDARNDPAELHNLANDPAHAATVRDLTARLQVMLAGAGDPARLDQPGFGLPS
ncbi:MAG: sulfatase-like hydrolase/transferase [bacterium]|nr:sulfatase-like hydrolase/transferase [bacterium]